MGIYKIVITSLTRSLSDLHIKYINVQFCDFIDQYFQSSLLYDEHLFVFKIVK